MKFNRRKRAKIKNLKGIIDSHIHIGIGNPPFDGFMKRGLNLEHLTNIAKKTGIIFVPKMHFAGLIRPVIEKGKILIFPSLTLNFHTGGFDSELVKQVADEVQPVRLAVFFPSFEAQTHLEMIDKPWFNLFKPSKEVPNKQKGQFIRYKKIWDQKRGINVLNKEGQLLSEVRMVIKAVQKSGSFLHTSHLGEKEMKIVVREAIKQGAEVVITHANARTNKLNLKTLVNLLREAQGEGGKVWVEFCAATWITGLKRVYTIEGNFVKWIKSLGAQHCIISSDSNGLEPNRENREINASNIPRDILLETPLDWIDYFVKLLMKNGITWEEIKQMLIVNPHRLLKMEKSCGKKGKFFL